MCQTHGLKNIAGAFITKSRVFWPYRLVTDLFQRLLKQYPQRFSIETNTPVTSVKVSPEDSAYPYLLTTPRGVIRAAKVFHCTNGFTGHLLPKLRGPIYPCRLTMSCSEIVLWHGSGTYHKPSIARPDWLSKGYIGCSKTPRVVIYFMEGISKS